MPMTKVTITQVMDYDTKQYDPSRRLVTVIPPVWSAQKPKVFMVSTEDAVLIQQWIAGEGMIQDLLPHWSTSQRELLMTGMDDEAFHRATKDDEDGD